jgi:alpha-galactosidase
MVDIIVSSGMKKAGYTYANLDDCWQISRAADGTIVADPTRFPSGIKALADYVHSKGLKFGIYTSGGSITCEGRPGSYTYEKKDVQTYADWGVDFIKVDWCGVDYLDTQAQYKIWQKEISASGRPMILSIAIATIEKTANNKVWLWGREAGQMWRTSLDIEDDWSDMLRLLDENSLYANYNGPGGWNDADMWAMMSSPLLAGNDLRNMSADIKDILTQPEVISLDQDPLGSQATLLKNTDGLQVWVKDLERTGQKAVVLLNRQDEAAEITVRWQELNFLPLVLVRDVWARHFEGVFKTGYTAVVPPHGVKLLKISGFNLEPLTSFADSLAPEHQYRLSDLVQDTTPEAHTQNYVNTSPSTNEIKMSLFSDAGFLLKRKCSLLTTSFEVDQADSDPATQLIFKVYGDGKLLYTSNTINYGEKISPILVNINQVKVLNLFLMPVDPHQDFIQIGKWLNPVITCKNL